ncbi:hypothetical protein CCO03_09955 [Comamonas serinivorans]|uniref:Uncharacterized protein n=2 Tax=Comamonas serinivorans TaxID=1082851 RepID=A0A1Y0ENH1_9BURK|nr:hypothetical protein CCO03_09955 [Comamonas serinivorans]
MALSIDGQRLATVCCDGFDVVRFHLQGTRSDPAFAHVHLGAGGLLWLNDVTVTPGQRVGLAVLAAGETAPAGQTLDLLYPDDGLDQDNQAEGEGSGPIEFDDRAAIDRVLNHVRGLPSHRAGYRFDWLDADGTRVSGSTAAAMHGITFSAVWNRFHPARVRVSLHTHTLASVGQRRRNDAAGQVTLARGDLMAGQSVSVTLSDSDNMEEGA